MSLDTILCKIMLPVFPLDSQTKNAVVTYALNTVTMQNHSTLQSTWYPQHRPHTSCNLCPYILGQCQIMNSFASVPPIAL
jgi:hypothetical protein